MSYFDPTAPQSIQYFPKEGPVHRSSKSPNKIITQIKTHEKTLFNALNTVFSSEEQADNPCFGVRNVVDGSKHFGPFVWKSYKEVKYEYERLASGLKELGLVHKDKIGIYCKNCPEWVYCIIACSMLDIIFVPLYDTLGPETYLYIINHSELETILTSVENLKKLLTAPTECPSLKKIIVIEELSEEDKALIKNSKIKIVELKNFKKKEEIKPVVSNPDDLLTIVYTSGTTGVPKGVMLSNSNIIAAISAIHFAGLQLNSNDVHLSYLPLAHIYEFMVTVSLICAGGRVGFWRGDIDGKVAYGGLIDDIQVLKPTVLTGAPRVFLEEFTIKYLIR